MKQVLIIDAPPLFCGFLNEKLITEKITVGVANGRRDAFTKTISMLPDLIVINVSEKISELMEYLEKKRENPNAISIPIILIGSMLRQELLAQLLPFKVIKYFNKPIKFDVFFEAIGRMLKTPLSIDTTPSIMGTHLNANIIFIEMAQGLNREKMSMIKYKISEMIDANKLSSPKIVLMMTNLPLSFVDSPNLELLLNNIIADTRVRHRYIKVLSLDSFTKAFVSGHAEYNGVEVVDNLSSVLNTLVTEGKEKYITDIIATNFLVATEDASEALIEMRFYSESGILDDSDDKNKKLLIAIVDDDAVVRKLLQAVFASMNADTELFDSGSEFLASTNKKIYDLVILDIFMPGISGFDILMNLRTKHYASPVLVYSNTTQKTSIVQALSLGAKGYLIKPLKPEAIIQKALEVLDAKV